MDITIVEFKIPQTTDSDTDSSQLSHSKGQTRQSTNSDDEGEDMEEKMEDEYGAAEDEEVGKEEKDGIKQKKG